MLFLLYINTIIFNEKIQNLTIKDKNLIDDLFKDVGTTFLDKDWQNGFDIIQEEIKC